MSYLVRSFRGYSNADTFEGAEKIAHDMILDIITDGFDCRFWWVKVIDTRLSRFCLVSCPKVGLWCKCRWFKFVEDERTF